MSDQERSCPRCLVALRGIDLGDAVVDFCPVCRGGFTTRGQLGEVLGQSLDGASASPPEFGDMDACAACGGAITRTATGQSTWFACGTCDGAWLEAGALSLCYAARAERGAAPSGAPAPNEPPAAAGPSAPAPAGARLRPLHREAGIPVIPGDDADDSNLAAARLPYDLPLVQYLSLPAAAVFGLLFGVVGLARPLVFFVQVWFHEIGHAVPAWLSSRAALPLPFGFTFWREESSWFTGLCVLFLLGVLGVASFREKRYYGVVGSAVLLGLWAHMTLVLDPYASIGWILFGGLAGELVLTTLAIVSFYYRAPDRMRWDFWRFLVLVPAMTSFVTSFAMWVRIDQGTQALPFGSIIGAPGDGTGDIERMLRGYAWTTETMTTTYRTLGTVCLVIIVAHYVFFALRARATPPRQLPPSPRETD